VPSRYGRLRLDYRERLPNRTSMTIPAPAQPAADRATGRHIRVAAVPSTAEAGAVLSLDVHAIGDKGHAGAGIGDAVYHHEAVEADAHAAVNTAGRPRCGATSLETLVDDEQGGDGFAGERHYRPTIEDNLELAASFEPVLASQWQAAPRKWSHYSPSSSSTGAQC
jgi:hypothetical protein